MGISLEERRFIWVWFCRETERTLQKSSMNDMVFRQDEKIRKKPGKEILMEEAEQIHKESRR